MRALLRLVLLLALAAGTLLSVPTPGMTSPKDELDYFIEPYELSSTDASGVQTQVSGQIEDGAMKPDTVFLSVTRIDPACAAADAGCRYVLLDGIASEEVAEGDVRVQPNLRWARVATTVTFVDAISGSRCAMTIDLTARATSEIFLEGYDDVSGFRQADATARITCGGEDLLGGKADGFAEIARFTVPD
jgi:hypothetical protein